MVFLIFHFKETGRLTPATLNYTNYLLRMCAMEPVEVSIAAILPCFWVYRDIGRHIAQHTAPHNPFARWIDTYAGDAFDACVREAITIFDILADSASDAIRAKMLDAFYKSTCLEWHFWNDVYQKTVFDDF
jgi:thiaminase (transcriptional activator TenA)